MSQGVARLPRASGSLPSHPLASAPHLSKLCEHNGLEMWRMNLTCASGGYLWIAIGSRVARIPLHLVSCLEDCSSAAEFMRFQCAAIVNQVASGAMGLLGMVAAVCDDGQVVLWNSSEPPEQTPVVLQNKGPTWSVHMSNTLGGELSLVHRSAYCEEFKRRGRENREMHRDQTRALIALGSNSFNATIFDLQDSDSRVRTFVGCRHNVPCVGLDQWGERLAAVSIDSCLRVWDVRSGALLRRAITSDWMWHVSWIPLASIRQGEPMQAELGCRFSSSIQFVPLTRDSVSLYNTVCEFPFAVELKEEDARRVSVTALGMSDGEEPFHSSDEEFDGDEDLSSDEVSVQENACDDAEEETTPADGSLGAQENYRSETLKRHYLESKELLLASTADTLLLFDEDLSLLATLVTPVPRPVFRNVHLDRLSMIEYLPEMSVALVVNQSSCFVSVVRIVSSLGGTSFAMDVQCLIPSRPHSSEFSRAHVAGLAVQKRTGEIGKESFDVLVTYSNGHVLQCNLSDAIELEMAKSLYVDII